MLQSQRDIEDTLTYQWKENRTHPTPQLHFGEGWRSPWASRLGSGIQGQWLPLLVICKKFPRRGWSQLAPKPSLLVVSFFVGCLGQNLAPQEAVCLPLVVQCLRCTVIGTVGGMIPTSATP